MFCTTPQNTKSASRPTVGMCSIPFRLQKTKLNRWHAQNYMKTNEKDLKSTQNISRFTRVSGKDKPFKYHMLLSDNIPGNWILYIVPEDVLEFDLLSRSWSQNLNTRSVKTCNESAWNRVP